MWWIIKHLPQYSHWYWEKKSLTKLLNSYDGLFEQGIILKEIFARSCWLVQWRDELDEEWEWMYRNSAVYEAEEDVGTEPGHNTKR